MLSHDPRRPVRTAITLAILALTALASPFTHLGHAHAAAEPKAVAKCQAGLAKSGAKFVAKKLGLLAKCTDGIVKCIQTIDDATADGAAKRTDCITKARAKCGAALAGIGAARTGFGAAAAKGCAGLDPAQITSADGLGFAGTCADFGGAPVTDLTSLTTCLAKGHDCVAGRIFQLTVPRTRELLQFTPPDAVTPSDPDALACIEDVGGSGADVNDVALGKSIAKCQKAVAKIGTKLASQRASGLAKCANALFACAAKTGEDLTKCNAKAQAGCAKAFAKNDDQSDAAKAATAKACGDSAVFAAFLSPAGGNLQALLPTALTAGPRSARALSGLCTALVTVADYQACLVAHLLGFADDLVTFETPRTETLLTSVGCSLDSCEGSGPPPPDVPGITEIVNAAGDGTHPLDVVRAVAADADGNAYVSGQSSGTVFKVTLGGTITLILGPAGDGQGHGCESIHSVATGPNHTVYVGCRDYVFKISGGAVTPILSPNGDGGPLSGFRSGSSIFVTPDETVYVTGALTDNAFKITKAGVVTQLIDENGDNLGHELLDPEGIAVDAQGNVYVTDIDQGGIFKITSAGAISLLLTSGFPTKVLVRGDDLYFSNLFRVVKRTPDGTLSTVIDSAGDGQGHLLDTPVGIAFDSVGNLYVAGGQSNNVFRVTPGGTKTQIIGPDGDGKGHPLDGPEDVAVDGQDRIITGGFGSDNAFRIILP